MTRSPPPDPFLDAKLLGILLAGGFSQTREECGQALRLSTPAAQSGVHRLTPPATLFVTRRPGSATPAGDE